MRWDYDPKWRDMFDDGVHRDILIVPHATTVTKVSGKPPIVTSKVPKFYPDDDPVASHHIDDDVNKEGKRIPDEYEPVEWTITNEDIIKEKFEFADGLCSNEKLSFGSCESAMIKFTIRNNKTYNEELGYWTMDIPDLQHIQVISEDGKTLLGELQGAAIINVWTYINGDSDSLMWLGMYKVEQDKASGNGYEREIIAYDFMLTFRDMDIFNWYRALFDGTPIDSDDWSKGLSNNYPKADEWTIGEALKNFFDNLAFMSPGKPTITNPKDYLMDMDADKYPGYGMPIAIDDDIWDMTVKAIEYPADDETDPDKLYERYGGMKIMDLPFRRDEKIFKKQALSCGKFLEDIATLAGRFGCIRKDKFIDDDYEDPDLTAKHRYNTYEKCILTFRPLPSTENLDKEDIRTENYFDNSDVEKGIQYEHFDVREVKIIDVYDYDNNRLFYFCPSGLKASTKKEWENGNRAELNVFNITENMFISYLKKDDTNNKFVIDLLKDGKSTTRSVPDYYATMERNRTGTPSSTPVMKTITYDGKPLLTPAFNSMKNKPYRPYQLSTSSDLCRMPGDIIMVEGVDKITGETYSFISYILVRRCTGIQKQMDKYTAKGDTYAGTYSDYRAGELNDSFHPQSLGYGRIGGGSSGNTNGNTVIEGLTEENLIEVLRNDGRRFLDEPTNVSAVYNPATNKVVLKWTDPEDLTDWKPHPAAWEGTVVIRSDTARPLSRYGGTKVVKSTTRDEYSVDGYEDTVEPGKHYFYVFMPYYTLVDDEDHSIYCYRWTKCVEVDTDALLTAPEITKITVDGVDATVKYKITDPASGSFTSRTLVVKKGSAPESSSDGDQVISLASGSTSVNITGLDENSKYYFEIFCVDTNSNTTTSEVKTAKTGEISFIPTRVLLDTKQTSWISYDNQGNDTGAYRHPVMANWKQVGQANAGLCDFKYGIREWPDQESEDIFSPMAGSEGNTVVCFQTPICRHKATKMYVTCRGTTSNISWRYSQIGFITDPSAVTDWSYWTPSKYVFNYRFSDDDNNTLGPGMTGSFPTWDRQEVEIDISSLPANQKVYLTIYKCNHCTVYYKIRFDDDIGVLYDAMPKTRVLLNADESYMHECMNSKWLNDNMWSVTDNVIIHDSSKINGQMYFNVNLMRHKATKMYIEAESHNISGGSSARDNLMVLAVCKEFEADYDLYNSLSVRPSNNTSNGGITSAGYNGVTSNYKLRATKKTIPKECEKQIFEFNIADMIPDGSFMIHFWSDTGVTLRITKIYFDKDIVIFNTRTQLPFDGYTTLV